MKGLTEKELDIMAGVQKVCKALFDSPSYATFSDRGVHLSGDCFWDTFGGSEVTVKQRDCSKYPCEYRATYDGVVFYTLGSPTGGNTQK